MTCYGRLRTKKAKKKVEARHRNAEEAESLRRQFKEAAPALAKRLDKLITKNAQKAQAVNGRAAHIKKLAHDLVDLAKKKRGDLEPTGAEMAEALGRKKKRGKPEPRKVDVISAIEESWSEIETLRGEIEEWQGNMVSANMDHVPKYEEVSECLSELEQLEEPEMGDIAGSLRSHMMEIVDPSPRKRGYSRPERLAQAVHVLSNAAAELEQLKEWIEELHRSVDDLVSSAETINFPKMF